MLDFRSCLVALALLAGLSACDSNDDRRTAVRYVDNAYGGGTPAPVEPGPATVEFPPPVSRTQDASVTARGRLAAGVSASLGGIALTPDAEGRWQLDLPLLLDANTFALEYTVDGVTTTVPNALEVTYAPDDLVALADLVVDSDNERLLILDAALNRVVAVDFATQTPVGLLTDDTALTNPYGLTMDPVNNRVVILQRDADAPFVAVDLTAGTSTELESPDFPNDLARDISLPIGLSADEGGYLVLALERVLVDLSSRDRLPQEGLIGDDVDQDNPPEYPANSALLTHPVIYRFEAGGNVEFIYEYEDRDNDVRFGTLYGFAAVPGDPNLYVSDSTSIKRINRASADIAELIVAADQNADLDDQKLTADPSLYYYRAPRNLDLQPDLERLVALDSGRIVSIALDNGDAEVIASDLLDDDPLTLLNAQAMRAEGQRAWILDDAQDRVVEFDLASGERSLAFDRSDGGAPPLLNPADIALNPATLRAYVTDNARGTLVEFNLNDGTTRILAEQGGTTEDPVRMGAPLALEIAGDGSKVLLINSRAEVLGVDIASGDKELLLAFDPDRNMIYDSSRYQLSDLAVDAAAGEIYVSDIDIRRGAEIRLLPPTGEASVLITDRTRPNRDLPITSPAALALDAAHERLLVVDSGLNAVLAVDIATGARSFMSERPAAGSAAPLIELPQDLAIDTQGGRALILDSSQQGLIAVDLETGTLSVVGNPAEETRDRIYTARGLTLHPTHEYALIVDNTTDKVWALDLLTGERVSIGR